MLGILAVVALFAAVTLGPVVYRMSVPIPPADIAAIRGHLAPISQTPDLVERLWFGGPWRMGRRLPYQAGRPYRVTAREADGTRWVHILAADGLDGAGAPLIRERIEGIWTRRPG